MPLVVPPVGVERLLRVELPIPLLYVRNPGDRPNVVPRLATAAMGGNPPRLDLLKEQAGGELLTLQVAVYGIGAPTLEMLGHVGQGVVDLAAQQILTVIQLCETHAFTVADSLSVLY